MVESSDTGGAGAGYIGVVKSYNEEKGWGHISCDETRAMYGKDVFVMRSAVRGCKIETGHRVQFTVETTDRGPQAAEVRSLEQGADYASHNLEGRIFTGEIKQYDEEKGWGFIKCADTHSLFGKDVFVHKREFSSPLGKGALVQFAVNMGRDGRPEAKNIIPLPQGFGDSLAAVSGYGDWSSAASLANGGCLSTGAFLGTPAFDAAGFAAALPAATGFGDSLAAVSGYGDWSSAGIANGGCLTAGAGFCGTPGFDAAAAGLAAALPAPTGTCPGAPLASIAPVAPVAPTAPVAPVAPAAQVAQVAPVAGGMIAGGTPMIPGGTPMVAGNTSMVAGGTSMVAGGTGMLAGCAAPGGYQPVPQLDGGQFRSTPY